MTWMSFLIVSLWISSLSGVLSQNTRLLQNTDDDFSSTRVFPGVPFDSESSKENHSKVSSPYILQDVGADFSSTRVFPGVPFDSESSKQN